MKKAIVIFILIAAVLAVLLLVYFKFIVIPNRVSSYLESARISLEKGNYQEAGANARRAIRIDNRSALGYLILARSVNADKSVLHEETLRYLKKAEELGDASISLYTELADVNLELGNWDEAKENLDGALTRNKDDLAGSYYKVILLLYGENNPSAAAALAERITGKYPENPAVKRVLALAYHLSGDEKKSFETINAAIESKPDYCLFYTAKAEIYKTKSPTDAEEALNKAEKLALKSGDLIARYCLSNVYSQKGDLSRLRGDPEEITGAFYEQAMNINIPRGKISDTYRESAVKYSEQ